MSALPARAQSTITVTTTSDASNAASGDCTLREALQAAATDAAVDACAAGSGADVIVFEASLSGQTITLGGSALILSTDVTVDASALPRGLTISGGGASRVFEVTAGVAMLRALTVTGGNASRGGGL
ncbi:MAG TPA: CSLREA domain-containing protein, partial [Rhodothermales bacterium]|nr:CSLREA domain-containing protein [Rhodothermales bacterium]